MTCPDNLLIAARRGALSAEERARLEAHLAECASCRLSLRVGEDFDRVLETMAGDEKIAERFARELGSRVKRKRVRAAWVLGAVGVVVSVGLAAAAVRYAEKSDHDDERDHDHIGERVDERVHDHVDVYDHVDVDEHKEVAVVGRDAGIAKRASAKELFAAANTKRREGEARRARSLYRELQRLYPRSAESEVSFVSLGRVCLELGEEREALEQFERYLKKNARGALAEEALFGKASALERLGRAAAERATWQALLESYPQSVYADRARARLERIP